jgi:hypothetical protein
VACDATKASPNCVEAARNKTCTKAAS